MNFIKSQGNLESKEVKLPLCYLNLVTSLQVGWEVGQNDKETSTWIKHWKTCPLVRNKRNLVTLCEAKGAKGLQWVNI